MFYCKFVEGSSGEWTASYQRSRSFAVCYNFFGYNFCKSQMEISLSPPSTFAIRSMVRAAYPETLNFWQALVNFLLCGVGFDFPPERVPDAWSESIKLWRGFEFNENLLCWMSFLSFLTNKDRELSSLLAVDMLNVLSGACSLFSSNLTLSVNRFSIVQMCRCRRCSCRHVSFRDCMKET